MDGFVCFQLKIWRRFGHGSRFGAFAVGAYVFLDTMGSYLFTTKSHTRSAPEKKGLHRHDLLQNYDRQHVKMNEIFFEIKHRTLSLARNDQLMGRWTQPSVYHDILHPRSKAH